MIHLTLLEFGAIAVLIALVGAGAVGFVLWDWEGLLVSQVLRANRERDMARETVELYRRASEAAYPARYSTDPAVNAWLPDPALLVDEPATAPAPAPEREPETEHLDAIDVAYRQLLTDAAVGR